MMDKIRIVVQREKFDIETEIARVKGLSRKIGGLVLFIGTAREDSAGRMVGRLEFEEYPEMAEKELRSMAMEAEKKFGLSGLTIIHRTGVIPVGENIVLIITAAPHRKEAYSGSRWCIDELKKRIPIWKKEVFTDGEAWVQENP